MEFEESKEGEQAKSITEYQVNPMYNNPDFKKLSYVERFDKFKKMLGLTNNLQD